MIAAVAVDIYDKIYIKLSYAHGEPTRHTTEQLVSQARKEAVELVRHNKEPGNLAEKPHLIRFHQDDWYILCGQFDNWIEQILDLWREEIEWIVWAHCGQYLCAKIRFQPYGRYYVGAFTETFDDSYLYRWVYMINTSVNTTIFVGTHQFTKVYTTKEYRMALNRAKPKEYIIQTNLAWRKLLSWGDVPKTHRGYFDYLDEEQRDHACFIFYKKVWYELGQFERLGLGSIKDEGWDGVHMQSYSTGVVVKLHRFNNDLVRVGSYRTLSTPEENEDAL